MLDDVVPDDAGGFNAKVGPGVSGQRHSTSRSLRTPYLDCALASGSAVTVHSSVRDIWGR
jgi:hypothetical protein